MKTQIKLAAALLLASFCASAQNNISGVFGLPVSSSPVGLACVTTSPLLSFQSNIYSCQSSAYALYAGGGGGGLVASVFGRTGAVLAVSGDYVWGQIGGTLSSQTDLQSALNALAPLDSPTFTTTAHLPATSTFNGNVFTTASTTATGTSGATIPLLNGANTYSGASTFSAAGAASTPGVKVTGAPNTGSATTSYPQTYLDAGASEPTTFSTSGTMFAANAPAAFAGHFADFFVNGGSSVLQFLSTGSIVSNATLNATTGTFKVFQTNGLNCSSSASPAVCAAAPAGSFVIAAAATSVVVNTTDVTANSQIFVQEDSSLGTKLSVTCNTGDTIAADAPKVTARTAGTSFTVTVTGTVSTNPACYSYFIVN